MAVTIDVFSDVVCPWSFIGKRRLERALELYAAESPGAPPPEVHWRAFELNPEMPGEGEDRRAYYERKFGEGASDVREEVIAAGREVGIEFAFERVRRQPNTRAAHALIVAAAEHGIQDAVVEAMFRSFFLAGVDLSLPENLRKVAVDAGLDPEVADLVLEQKAAFQQVEAEQKAAREIGVDGVPVFIFNHRYAVTGSQPAEVILDAIRHAEAAR